MFTAASMKPKDTFLSDFQDLAYVKPVVVDGVTLYAVHAADGMPLTVLQSLELAFAAVRQYEMVPVNVQ